ncbi:Lrp/AsnC ligand binding domain-containing protein [Streptomyces sp. NPDC005355]|uniref:Lrp/AsnC ligand binding domain-containing protein n=1 Tax=Streptomyces sp. NPDC005355 TaxID=3157038 RepID=UPI0033AFCAD4
MRQRSDRHPQPGQRPLQLGDVRRRVGRVVPASRRADPAAQCRTHSRARRTQASVAACVVTGSTIEAFSTTGGAGDPLTRVVARDNEHLEDVVQRLIRMPGVVRTRTEVALRERVRHRMLPLVDAVGRAAPAGRAQEPRRRP